MHAWIKAAALAATMCCATAQAAGSNENEAKKLLAKAVDYFQQNGVEKGADECNRLDGQFNAKSEINPHGDLYIFVVQMDGVMFCHGKNTKLRGKDTQDLKDQNGVMLTRSSLEICKTKGIGSFDYVWPHPEKKALAKKRAYVQRIPNTQLCMLTGIYLED